MSVWFVTGASRGFDAEIFKEALARGNQVIATARKPEDIPFSGDNLLALTLDVTDENQARAAVDSAGTVGKVRELMAERHDDTGPS